MYSEVASLLSATLTGSGATRSGLSSDDSELLLANDFLTACWSLVVVWLIRCEGVSIVSSFGWGGSGDPNR